MGIGRLNKMKKEISRLVIVDDFSALGERAVEEPGFLSGVMARAGRSPAGAALLGMFGKLEAAVSRNDRESALEAHKTVMDNIPLIAPSYPVDTRYDRDQQGKDAAVFIAAANFLLRKLQKG